MSSSRIRLDLNNPDFQNDLFRIAKNDQRAILTTLAKLLKMTWEQIYVDPGLRWEAVISRVGPNGGRIYSLRVGSGFRAIAYREEEWLRFLTLHPDHDSAYR